MFPNPKALLVIVSCALVAQAQSTTTTTTAPASESSVAGLDTCILGCVTAAAASGGCSSYTDLSCVCTSSAFQQAATACLQANCSTADQAAAEQLQTTECAALSSGSASASTAASTATSNGTSSASASASASATSTSAAMALSGPFSFGNLVGALVASAGVLVGAAFVL